MNPVGEALTKALHVIANCTAEWQSEQTKSRAILRYASSQLQLADGLDSAEIYRQQLKELKNRIKNSNRRIKLWIRVMWTQLLYSVVEPDLLVEHVKTVIEHGADFRVVRFGNKATLLHKVVESHDFDVEFLKFLLDRGAFVSAVNSEGQTALDLNLQLYYFHHCEATVALLEKTPQKKINEMDRCGKTYLMKAADTGCSRCVEAFLQREADVNMAPTYGTLPVVLYLMNGERSPAAVETFRLLLQKTDRQKLLRLLYVHRRENPDSEFEPLAYQVSRSRFEYFDVIWVEGYQLLFFSCGNILRDTDEGDYSLFDACDNLVSLGSFPEPHLTAITEVCLHQGVLCDPRIYGKVSTGKIGAKFFLIFVHRGLNTPAKLFKLDQLLSQWHWWDNGAGLVVMLELLGTLGIADNHFLTKARDIINQKEAKGHCSLKETLRLKCSLLGTEVRSLKRICSTAIREHLFQNHGQIGLVPLIPQLEVPDAVGDIILCRDVQIGEY